MSNKDKLRAYKVSIAEQENKPTLDELRTDIDHYGSFHIDIFAERVCEIDECIELKKAAQEYLKKVQKLRDIFSKIARKYDFDNLRERESGGGYAC